MSLYMCCAESIVKLKLVCMAMAKAKRIPVDLIRDIIGRLSDPKSLCRFKIISKSLSSMIAEIKRIDLVLVSANTVYSADLDSPGSLKVLHLPDEILDNSTLTIDGSYNGFVLFTTNLKITLWSKFSGDYKVIAREPHPSPPYDTYSFLISGFGYDSVNDDYKLVEILCSYDGVYCPSGYIIRIYCFRNRTWRRPHSTTRISPFPYICDSFYNTKQAVLVGSALHWVAHWVSNCIAPAFVIAFDLTTEEFHEIELPEKTKATVVGAFEGCLTVTHPKDEIVDIWVMKEYMVKESWTHQFRISVKELYCGYYPSEYLRPLAASSRNGKKILFQSGRGLLWYDSEDNKLDFVDNSFQQLGYVYRMALCSWPTS